MNDSAFNIRPATPDDLTTLSGILAEDDEYYHAALPDIFAKPAGGQTGDYFLSYIGKENAAMFVAGTVEALAGYITVTINETPASPLLTPRTYAKIRNIAVASTWRHKGVGSALAAAAIHWAGDRGVTDIELDVYEFNAGATAFYESLGFEILRKTMRLKYFFS